MVNGRNLLFNRSERERKSWENWAPRWTGALDSTVSALLHMCSFEWRYVWHNITAWRLISLDFLSIKHSGCVSGLFWCIYIGVVTIWYFCAHSIRWMEESIKWLEYTWCTYWDMCKLNNFFLNFKGFNQSSSSS